MNILDIQHLLDQYYQQGALEKAYAFLMEQTQIAIEKQEDYFILFLLNELIGYYRATSQFEEGNIIIEKALMILEVNDLKDTLDGSTTYLNIATFYRAQGKYQKSLSFYQKTEKIYQELLDPLDERYSGFYNNMSLLYQELGEYQKALKLEQKALNIISQLTNCESELAITYTNFSHIYLALGDYQNAKESIQKAMELFDKNDSHYFAAIAMMAQLSYLDKDYQEAIDYYDQALKGLEDVYGQNKDYQIVYKNKQKVLKEMTSMKGIDLCEQYYLTYGKPMLEKDYSTYLSYMAIGLCGFGSDALGYDDDISRDHDFGPGFCIWLPEKIYQKIGKDLQDAYNQLPKEFRGYQRQESCHGQGRVGVFSIERFFYQFIKDIPETLEQWLYIDENALLCCTNGKIFEDYFGEVTKIRNYLSYYPEDIRLKKIARAIAKMAQSGQYNYARCMKRQDHVSAFLALNEFIDETMSVIYLLNKRYKPYYKWSFYGLKDCSVLKDIQPLIEDIVQLPVQSQAWSSVNEEVNTNDRKIICIEKICQRVIQELKKQGLTNHDDDFLDHHTMNVMSHIQDQLIKSKHVMEG